MKKIDVIKNAKDIYLHLLDKNQFVGMCFCMKVSTEYPGIRYRRLIENIPEFNPKDMNAGNSFKFPGLDFWWDIADTQSRLEAFDKLIEIYKDNEDEFIY